MFQNVAVIGTGNVGGSVVRQVFNKGDNDSTANANPTRIVGLAYKKHDKIHAFRSTQGIDRDWASGFCEGKYPGHVVSSLDEFREAFAGFGEKVIYVDTTADENMLDFHKSVILESDREDGIVAANKKPLVVCDMPTFDALTEMPTRYGYRCSVMAGAHAVELLRALRDLNDPPLSIEGCFSGTLGYITTELHKGRNFSDIVTEARALRYTEPHPRDDLSGADVARKLLILARTAGFNVNYGDIKLDPFVASSYLSQDNPDEFISSLRGLDEEFARRVVAAEQRGCVLKYVASLKRSDGHVDLSVGLREVPKASRLGSLSGPGNEINIVTETYPADKLFYVGAPGAGPEVTAQNIRWDILDQLPSRKLRSYRHVQV
jgi:homoserine dehydrogenase